MAPDSTLTYKDLLIRVAEAAGIASYINPADAADNTAQVPTDPHNLDLCKRAVNDGLDQFYLSNPRWSFLKPTVSLSLSSTGVSPASYPGDTTHSRYLLPWYIQGNQRTPWTWSYATAKGSVVRSTSMHDVRARHAHSVAAGPPMLCAVDVSDAPVPVGARPLWELRVWPRPDRDYVMESQFDIQPRGLAELGERVVAGARHDQTVIAFCIAQLARSHGAPDSIRSQLEYWDNHRGVLLAQSLAFDAEQDAGSLGVMNDPGVEIERRGGARPIPAVNGFVVAGSFVPVP